MGQKRILLTFVETVDLVHKHNRAPTVRQCDLCLLHCLPNLLYAPQYRADGNKLRVKRTGHKPCNGGLANPGWPPQNTAVGLARLKRQPQGHAFTQYVLLANHLTQGFRAQAFGQGLVGRCEGGYQGNAINRTPKFNPALRLHLGACPSLNINTSPKTPCPHPWSCHPSTPP